MICVLTSTHTYMLNELQSLLFYIYIYIKQELLTMKTINRCTENHFSICRMHRSSWSRYVLVVVIILTQLIKETMQTCTVITTATTSIATNANSGCTTITSVTIPSIVTYVGQGLILPRLFNYYYYCTCFITT